MNWSKLDSTYVYYEDVTNKNNSSDNNSNNPNQMNFQFVKQQEGDDILSIIKQFFYPLPKLFNAIRGYLQRFIFGLLGNRQQKTSLVKLITLGAVGLVLLKGSTLLPSKGETSVTVRKNAKEGFFYYDEASYAPNSASPVSPLSLKEEEVQHYVERFGKVAVAEMRKFGVPASIALAQGLVESNAGKSSLSTKNNNHFGIKCFSKACKLGHCSNFGDDSHKDFFVKYTSAWQSWRDHSELLSSGRYKDLHQNGKNYQAWANGLQQLGYATDRAYAQKLIQTIEAYGLYKLDAL